MADFPIVPPTPYAQEERPNQRNILPSAIKLRSFSNITIDNSDISYGFFSVSDQVGVTTTLRWIPTPDENVIVGAVPFQIVYLEGTALATASLIPLQVASGRYFTSGPFAMPIFTTDTFRGSTETNIRFITSIFNNSGGTQSLIRVSQLRYILGGAGEIPTFTTEPAI